MTEPSKKNEVLTSMLDEMSKKLFGASRSSSIREDTCVTCGNGASLFNDDISRKEFTISGMCQDCQDSVFGG